jgi:hypothetical protein
MAICSCLPRSLNARRMMAAMACIFVFAAQVAVGQDAASLDILGVRLGMSPKEVRAAFQAANPALSVEQVNSRLADPTDPHKYTRFPHFFVAHTVNKFNPEFANLPDGSSESIAVEFTMPPNSPVADRIIRRVQFPNGKPVLARTLIEALEKKYGPSNAAVGTNKVWAMSGTGKLLAQGLPQSAGGCLPSGAFPVGAAGSQGRDVGDISLANTADSLNPQDDSPVCAQFAFISAVDLASVRLDQPMHSFEVFIESGPLYVKSRMGIHQWLQAEADAHNKSKAAADAGRAAPAL